MWFTSTVINLSCLRKSKKRGQKSVLCVNFTALAAILLVSIPASLYAASKKDTQASQALKPATSAIPRFPGGQMEMEVSLTRHDILPMVQDLIKNVAVNVCTTSISIGVKPSNVEPVAPASQASSSPNVSIDLDKFFSQVIGIQLLQMDVPISTNRPLVEAFYTRFPKSKAMTRILYMRTDNGGAIQLWSGPNGNGLYGLRMFSETESPGSLTIQVARLDGHLNTSDFFTPEKLKLLLGMAGMMN